MFLRQSDPEIASEPGPALESRRYAILAVLALVYVLNFVDRQIVSVLAQPIKEDLRLSDSQIGLLSGFMFVLFYTIFGIPVAWLADKANRVWVVTISCALWSLFSMACGLATGFEYLAAARIGVGIGEAGCAPASLSIIADYFPPEQRGKASALYALGGPVGAGIGAAIASSLAMTFGWRAAFYLLGALGILVAAILPIAVREPPRGRLDGHFDGSSRGASLVESMRAFFASPVLVLAALSSGLVAFSAYGAVSWIPAFLMREKGATLAHVAYYYSPASSIALGFGMWAGGYLVDRIGVSGRRGAAAALPAIATLIVVPFMGAAILAPGWKSCALLMMPALALNLVYHAPTLALIQNSIPSSRRGSSLAIALSILNIVGLGGGPLFVGVISDRFRAIHGDGAHALQVGLLSLLPIAVFGSVGFFYVARLIAADRR